MSLNLILEHAATPQHETSRSYVGGQLIIGRGDDADWQIDDPEMYVSRKHCIITDEGGTLVAIDASSDGLFVDGAEQPLGAGNRVALENQMRLRLGDYVIRVEMQAAEVDAPVEKPKSPFDLGPRDEVAGAPTPRPDNLPPKFGTKKKDPFARDIEDKRPPRPLDERDPFELDLKRDPRPSETPDGRDTGMTDPTRERQPLGLGGFFKREEDAPDDPPPAEKTTPWPPIEIQRDPGNAGPPEDTTPTIQATQTAQPAAHADPEPRISPKNPASDSDVLAALTKGMGVTSQEMQGLSLDEIEAIGARFRDMVDGLMFLLRTRSQERQKVRVAQTLMAKSGVNPLKSLPSTDEAILALILGRGDSYLTGDKAVPGAFRDLADHQIRTWSALQAALRSMIDRFDPQEVERELEDTGLLEQLVAGGRSAKMWQLYQERYRDIAAAAEERFLGEVGSDFRDAYETERN